MIKQLRGISNILFRQSIYYDKLFNDYLERLDCDVIQLEFVGILPPYMQHEILEETIPSYFKKYVKETI